MEENSKQRFVHCRINWKIENFCFACRPSNYTIFSPEFFLQGINLVKWRMSIELEYNESCRDSLVSFYLEKLTTSEQTNICVNWELTLKAGYRIFGPHENSVEFGKHYKHGQTGITTTGKIVENLFPLKPDTILIHLYFIAFDKEKSLKLNEKPARGLFLLSEDLNSLIDTKENYTDIKLKTKDKYIEAHKAVLSRNETFKTYITEAKNDSIEITNFDYETLIAFIRFLYSGNVEYVLDDPSISLIRCMEEFNCNPVKSYYIPEELTMHSKIKVESHEFHWIVAEIFNKEFFHITSPSIKRLNVNTIWNLTVSFDLRKDNYLSIFADITDGDKPCYFCLEFAIIDEAREEFFARRLIRNNKCYDNMGFKDFVIKNSLYDKVWTKNGGLGFLFKIRTSNGIHESSMGRHSMALVSPTESQSFKQLSEGMSVLLKSKNYCDISIKCGKETIQAHKCILVSRSPEFRRRFDNASPDKNLLILTYIEPDVLRIAINYIYTGILGDVTGSQLSQLYNLSSKEKFHIPSLREESLAILRKRMAYVSNTDINDVGKK